MNITSIHTPGSFFKYDLPLYSTLIPAGFPSPAEDFAEMKLDLNEYLIHHPAATFLVRASGESMTGAGIQSGDILVVDRSLEAYNGAIIIASIGGELMVKRMKKRGEKIFLVPDNTKYQEYEVDEEDFSVWGVVVWAIHQMK